jgi:hypothetical protein
MMQGQQQSHAGRSVLNLTLCTHMALPGFAPRASRPEFYEGDQP